MLIVWVLYRLKSSDTVWRAHLLVQTMYDLIFEPCEVDPEVWVRAATKPEGFKNWEYVFIYVDNILSTLWAKVI
jgi:hypothetical protein